MTSKGGTRGVYFFLEISIITLLWFDQEWPNLAWYCSWGEAYFQGSAKLHPKRAGPQRPQTFWDSCIHVHPNIWLRATKFGAITRVGVACFRRSTTHQSQGGWVPASPEFLGPQPTPKRFDLKRPNLIWCDVGRSVFLGVSHTPLPRGRGSCVHKIFGYSYMRALSMRNDNQVMRCDQTSCDVNFYRVDHKWWCVISLR